MPLTSAQEQTLANHIRANADAAVIAALAIRNDVELTRLYNLDASPAYPVWKRRVTRKEMHSAYVWTEMDTFTNLAKQFQFNLLISEGFVDPSDDNTRTGLQEIFSASGLSATRNALVALAKRNASVFERIFATAPTAGTAKLVVEGPVSIDDISNSLNRF